MSTKHEIVTADYQGFAVSFTDDGWFDATSAAAKFGKRPADWIRLDETKAYLDAVAEALGISGSGSLIRAKRNSGTWLHPKLAVRFAQWLDVRFAVWCDMQIDGLLRGTHTHFDRQRLRHEAAASYKVMSQIVQMTREAIGKSCAPHHFSNEARLVNWAASGKFQSIERDALSAPALDLLAKLEEKNAVLIGMGKTYEERKAVLQTFATVWVANHRTRIEATH
jgi:hypothetical protein